MLAIGEQVVRLCPIRMVLYARRGSCACGRNDRMGLTCDELLLSDARAEIIQYKYANCRRKVLVIATLVDRPDQGGHRRVLAICNFVQSIPELVFQRHTRFVSIAYDRALYDGGFHHVHHTEFRCHLRRRLKYSCNEASPVSLSNVLSIMSLRRPLAKFSPYSLRSDPTRVFPCFFSILPPLSRWRRSSPRRPLAIEIPSQNSKNCAARGAFPLYANNNPGI